MNFVVPDPPPDPLRLFLDTSLDGVVVMSAQGLIESWNSQAEEIFGWTQDEARGRVLADMIIPPEFRDAHARGIAKFLATGEGPLLRRRIEVTALRRSGEAFPVELTITPVFDGRWLFVGGLRDHSQRRRDEHFREQQRLKAETLYDAITFAGEAHSFEEALRHCLAAVGRLTGWPAGHVYLPTERPPIVLMPSGIWYCVNDEAFRPLQEITAGSYFSPGEGLAGQVWETGRPQWIADVDTHGNFLREKLSHAIGVRSAFGFPIKVRGEVIAILEFFSDIAVEPDPDLMLTFHSIGDQVGRVFERRQAERAIRDEAEALETINRINLSLAGELDLDRLVQAVTDAATQVTSAAFGAFVYRAMDDLNAPHAFCKSPGMPASVLDILQQPRDTGLFSPAFLADGAVRSHDVMRDTRYASSFPQGENPLPMRSYLAVPVIARSGEVIGGLFLGHPEPDRFTQRHQNIVAAIAVQASIGIENARLYRRAQSEIAERQKVEEHQKLLMGELNHRVKNTLAVVSGIASQTARNSRSMAAFNENFLARLNSLSRAHTLLTASNWQTTSLRTLIEETLSPHIRPDEGQLRISGPDVFLPPKPALAMSMILHELVTNAAKYGALTQPEGCILIEWGVSSSDSAMLDLFWRETGVPNVRTPRKLGFGSRMIRASIEHELGGVVQVTYGRDGIAYDFAFPLNQ